MIRKLSIAAVASLAFIAHSSEAADRIPLSSSMFSLAPGSSGDPGLLADEQALAGDPVAGSTADPVNTWLSTNGAHLNIAYLDLGAPHDLTHLAFYDRNGSADFRVYDDATNRLLVQDDLAGYQTWKVRALAVTTSRLRFENSTGFGRVPEIVLYGAVASGEDGGPTLPEFKVTEHTTASHRNFACHSSACTRTITAITGGQVVLSSTGAMPVNPGDRVCVAPKAGGYTGRIKLDNIRGTELSPIEITNCDGEVVFQNVQEAIQAHGSVHFKVLGNGHSSALYGFRIVGAPDAGVKVRRRSRDFEIGWIQFDDGHGVAVKAKSEEKGPDLVTGQPFVQTGTHVHHLRSNSTQENEAFYIGNTGCDPEVAVESWPDAPLRDVSVHDNILLDSGADGLQVGCATGDVRIFNNYIKKAGYRPFYGDTRQTHGIQVGRSSTGRVYQNWVEDSFGDCVHAEGGDPAGIQIYNNVLKGCPRAVYFNEQLEHAGEVVVANNTILTSSGQGFRASKLHRTRSTPTFRIYDNLFVGTTANTVMFYDDEQTLPLTSLHTLEHGSQLYFADFVEPRFMDGPGADYRLRSDSPARDEGTDTGFLGIVSDLRGVARPPGAYDVGAFEFKP
jgi:hypothetical protein